MALCFYVLGAFLPSKFHPRRGPVCVTRISESKRRAAGMLLVRRPFPLQPDRADARVELSHTRHMNLSAHIFSYIARPTFSRAHASLLLSPHSLCSPRPHTKHQSSSWHHRTCTRELAGSRARAAANNPSSHALCFLLCPRRRRTPRTIAPYPMPRPRPRLPPCLLGRWLRPLALAAGSGRWLRPPHPSAPPRSRGRPAACTCA